MLRTRLYAAPEGRFLHDVILESCRRVPEKTAVVDTSCNRRFSYSEYGALVESLARGLVAHGLQAGGGVALFFPNPLGFFFGFFCTNLAGGRSTLFVSARRGRQASR